MQFNWSKEAVQAIKACWSTNEGRIALAFVVESLGLLHGDSESLDPHDMAFTKGRRFVARELMIAINSPIDAIIKEPDDRPARPLTATERANAAASGTAASPIAAARSRARTN